MICKFSNSLDNVDEILYNNIRENIHILILCKEIRDNFCSENNSNTNNLIEKGYSIEEAYICSMYMTFSIILNIIKN